MTDSLQDKIVKLQGTGVWVVGDDLDTDRIIPAEYLKCVTFNGLGEFAFYNARFDENGNATEHPLNDGRFEGASVMLSGRNFGCGSSREHAPQSLYRAGFRVIIAESFAEIFFGNCTTLGLVCVRATRADINQLGELLLADPSLEITVDLDTCEIHTSKLTVSCSIPSSARDALRGGYWDPLSNLLTQAQAVDSTFQSLPYREWTR